MKNRFSPFVKFTYTIVDLNGLPQQKSRLINLAYVVSIEADASNDLKIFLSNNQVVSISLGEHLDASEIMDDLLSLSAVGTNYSVYKIEAFDKK